MTKPTKLGLWIICIFKFLAISYIAIFTEVSVFMQLVILPLLLLESMAVAGYVFEAPTLTKSSAHEQYMSIATAS